MIFLSIYKYIISDNGVATQQFKRTELMALQSSDETKGINFKIANFIMTSCSIFCKQTHAELIVAAS